MLELEALNAASCPSCGSADWWWRDDDGEEIWPPEWEAVAVSCPGCAALEAKQDQVDQAKQQASKSMSRGGRIGLRRVR